MLSEIAVPLFGVEKLLSGDYVGPHLNGFEVGGKIFSPATVQTGKATLFLKRKSALMAARAHIAEATRFFALSGRPTKAQFIKLYGTRSRDDLGSTM